MYFVGLVGVAGILDVECVCWEEDVVVQKRPREKRSGLHVLD